MMNLQKHETIIKIWYKCEIILIVKHSIFSFIYQSILANKKTLLEARVNILNEVINL